MWAVGVAKPWLHVSNEILSRLLAAGATVDRVGFEKNFISAWDCILNSFQLFLEIICETSCLSDDVFFVSNLVC